MSALRAQTAVPVPYPSYNRVNRLSYPSSPRIWNVCYSVLNLIMFCRVLSDLDVWSETQRRSLSEVEVGFGAPRELERSIPCVTSTKAQFTTRHTPHQLNLYLSPPTIHSNPNPDPFQIHSRSSPNKTNNQTYVPTPNERKLKQ